MQIATREEYLDWFYHTIRIQFNYDEAFEAKMAKRFEWERDMKCPFYIPKNAVDTRKT